ncbi:hypothetical protein MM326_03250 [Alkalihalobacillus sp. LMS6]|nr:hypothetical protein [Alkalihalobacillus sp. LMS6]UTR07063.1 hypothetical protein MM326_03250 [Alkalihalobacillus sp. LMS6]
MFKARVLQAEVFASLNQELQAKAWEVRVEDEEMSIRLQDIEDQLNS